MSQTRVAKRRWMHWVASAVGLLALPLWTGMSAARPSETGTTSGGMTGDGMMGDGMMGGMMGDGMGPEMMRDMGPIRGLLSEHEKIRRTVEDIPQGIRATTTSEDPEIAALIRTHVWQMKGRLERGEPIRMMDPLFREIFRHHREVRLEIEDVPGGVRVTETSANPRVVLLIRQHAHRAVSEFVEGGMRRAMRPTPLPPGYEPPASSPR